MFGQIRKVLAGVRGAGLEGDTGHQSASSVHAAIRACITELTDFGDSLMSQLKIAAKNSPDNSKEKKIYDVAVNLAALTDTDLRKVNGFITLSRDKGNSLQFQPDLERKIAKLKSARGSTPIEEATPSEKVYLAIATLYKEQFPLPNSASCALVERKAEIKKINGFLTDLMVLSRSINPLGVNILNANSAMNLSETLSAKDDYHIAFFGGEKITVPGVIHIEAKEKKTEVSMLFSNDGNVGQTEKHVIGDGEALVLGRPLPLTKLFGSKLAESLSIQGMTLPPDDKFKHVSRAGIILIRLGQKLYLFDRGNMNDLELWTSRVNERGDRERPKAVLKFFASAEIVDRDGERMTGISEPFKEGAKEVGRDIISGTVITHYSRGGAPRKRV